MVEGPEIMRFFSRWPATRMGESTWEKELDMIFTSSNVFEPGEKGGQLVSQLVEKASQSRRTQTQCGRLAATCAWPKQCRSAQKRASEASVLQEDVNYREWGFVPGEMLPKTELQQQ